MKEITGPEIVHLGESYNLTCSVATIDEETEITWYRGNTPLLPHSTFYYDDKVTSNSVYHLLNMTNMMIPIFLKLLSFSWQKIEKIAKKICYFEERLPTPHNFPCIESI